jgi:hypothetical protein
VNAGDPANETVVTPAPVTWHPEQVPSPGEPVVFIMPPLLIMKAVVPVKITANVP